MAGIVEDTAQQIFDMRIRGAGRIARAGASAIGEFAKTYEGDSLERFLQDLDGAVATMIASRPTAVSLRNGVLSAVKGVSSASTLEEAKAMAAENAERFARSSSKAVETIAAIGAKRIKDGDTVLTHCNSSAAVGVIKEASRQGKSVKVYATETRPWRQGIVTVRELADAGIDVTLIVDSAVRSVMRSVDEVFVGADTITSDGVLINKVGTSQIALAANEARVPFYVCAETYKFSPLTLSGDTVVIEERDAAEVAKPGEIPDSVKIFNPVFDSTPGRYIDALITEEGLIPPGAVYSVMCRLWGVQTPFKE